jgi:hypothetical protein
VANAVQPTSSSGGPPTGAAGGDLGGSYPDPEVIGFLGSGTPETGEELTATSSASADWLNPAGEFSVLAFGGDPSGADESTAAIAAAQAAALAAGGGYVTFGPGIWKFDTTTVAGIVSHPELYVTPPLVHFRFAGPGSTVLTPANGDQPLFDVQSGTEAAAVRFEGGFTVQAHSSGSSGPAIDLTGARQWLIESPSYLDSSGGTSGSPGMYAQVIGYGINSYACRITDPVCEGQMLGACFAGAIDPASVVANDNTITNPLFEANTAPYMIDAAGTEHLAVTGGIIEGNEVTAAVRLGFRTQLENLWTEANPAWVMDDQGVDSTDPGSCMFLNCLMAGSEAWSIPAGVALGTTFIGCDLDNNTLTDNTSSYATVNCTGGTWSHSSFATAAPVQAVPYVNPDTSGTITVSLINHSGFTLGGGYQRINLSGNATIAAAADNESDGMQVTVEIHQPASGGPFTVAWSSAFLFGPAGAPPLSSAASAADVFTFRYNLDLGQLIWMDKNAAPVPDIQFFTTTGGNTWSKPSGAQTVQIALLGAGGGGGSGRRGASGSVCCGGGGAAGGAITQRQYAAADLGSTVTVTVGAGGAGGAAITADSTNGNIGSAGAATTFGTLAYAGAGAAGAGGTATAGGGAAGSTLGTSPAGGGSSASASGAGGPQAPNAPAATGGGAGGGITVGAAASAGGLSGGSVLGNISNIGTAGVVDGTPPGPGTQPSAQGTPSCGGPGGCSSVTTAAQAGATPFYGGGGGGGGASLNGSNSGAGGTGGPGWALIITYFG